MKCDEIKNKLADLTEGLLEEREARDIRAHLAGCADCAKELQAIENAWDMVGALDAEEPEPGYVSRFWIRLAHQEPWYRTWAKTLRPVFSIRILAPVASLAVVLIIAGMLHLAPTSAPRTAVPAQGSQVAQVSGVRTTDQVSVELVENLDMLEDLDMLENWEYLEAMGRS